MRLRRDDGRVVVRTVIGVMCLQQRQISVVADGQTDTASNAQPDGALTSEQRAAVFGSTEAAGRQLTPKAKHRAVSSARGFSSVALILGVHNSYILINVYSLYGGSIMKMKILRKKLN